MKVVMYGTKACPDCVEAEEILKEKGIQYLYMEFSDNIGYLKRFLTLRDTNPIFDEVKENVYQYLNSSSRTEACHWTSTKS